MGFFESIATRTAPGDRETRLNAQAADAKRIREWGQKLDRVQRKLAALPADDATSRAQLETEASYIQAQLNR